MQQCMKCPEISPPSPPSISQNNCLVEFITNPESIKHLPEYAWALKILQHSYRVTEDESENISVEAEKSYFLIPEGRSM